MTLAREAKLRTLAVTCLYLRSKEYPREAAAHIAFRTVRRFLDHYPDAFDRIVWCVVSTSSFTIKQLDRPSPPPPPPP